MYEKNYSLKQKIFFAAAFLILGIIFLQVPFTAIVGSAQHFTLFDFYAPMTGIFLGGPLGFIAVVLAKLINTIITNKPFDILTIIRFFPLAFAAIYLATKQKWVGIIGPLCMIVFIAHPIGREAWYYTLYWLIPLAAVFLKKRLILNALGSTFTAHAIGSTIFLYSFDLPAASWTALIPQVAMERGLFAVGIWVSVVFFNWLLIMISKRYHALQQITNADYWPSKEFFKHHA